MSGGMQKEGDGRARFGLTEREREGEGDAESGAWSSAYEITHTHTHTLILAKHSAGLSQAGRPVRCRRGLESKLNSKLLSL